MMSEMSSSEKPEFCFPTRRGSRTFCVAVRTFGQREAVNEAVETTEEAGGTGVPCVGSSPSIGSDASSQRCEAILGSRWGVDGGQMRRV